MDIVNDDAMISITLSGKISFREITELLQQHYGSRNILVNVTHLNDNFINFDAGDIDLRSTQYSLHQNRLSDEVLNLKDKQIRELEKTTEEALNSVQTFQRQHQALYERCVTLKKILEEQKAILLKTLWTHCRTYHPDLREIPSIQDMTRFTESEDRVGDFQVGETLGQGQTATVRSCWRDGTKTELAVKIIKKDRFTTFEALKRVSNEIEILRKLRCQFIVSVKEVVQTTDNLYIVTEKGGRDLFDSFDEGDVGVPESWAKEIIICLLKAVLYCHDHDICHRDLKPENILIIFDKDLGRCIDLKLCDFGLSTRFSSASPLTDFCGSPGFFAPEMIIAGKYEGDKADLWSTGCVLLELLFGHTRFNDEWMSVYESAVNRNDDVFTADIMVAVEKFPKALNFSPPLNDFIMRLLTLNPANRSKTRSICTHPWLEGAFDSLFAGKSSVKHKVKRRPSISDVVSQSDSALMPMSIRPKGFEGVGLKESSFHRHGSTDGVGAESGGTSFDELNIPTGQKSLSAVTLPSLQKDKSQSQLTALETDEANSLYKSYSTKARGGESPRAMSTAPLLNNKKVLLSSPTSSGKSNNGDDGYFEKSVDKAGSKGIRRSFDSMSADMVGDPLNRSSEMDLHSRLGKTLPPISDSMGPRGQEGTAYDERVDGLGDLDNSSNSDPQGLVNAAISCLSRGISRRTELSQSPPLEADSGSGGNSCNSAGSNTGVSFFGYGSRQYAAPRGSFANEFSAPRGSFANDLCTNPRGSFVSECGTNPRSSFFGESKISREFVTRTSCIPSMVSSVTSSPTGVTPLATPTASGTPHMRNIEEETDELTTIDDLRNFLSTGAFSFLDSK